MIPPQLCVEGFRFIKIRSDNKKVPLETDWTNTANYGYNNVEIQDWVKSGYNYGVATGFGNLIVLDSDDDELKNIIEKEFPKTFTVRTGGGGFHYYYICPDQDKIVIENGRHLGELQSKGQQVIGPGSTHPNGKLYKIVEDRDIVELPKHFIELLPKNEYNKKNTSTHTTGNTFNLDVTDVIPLTGLTKKGSGEYQGPHPIHGSNQGMNFTLNPSKNVWHCFRHNCGGGAIDWVAMEEGIIQCGQTLEKPQLVKAIEIAKSKYGMVDKEEEGKKQETHKENYIIKSEILAALSIKDRATATEIMTQVLEEEEYIYTIKDDNIDEIWIYHEGIYIPNGISAIKEKIREILGDSYSTTYANQVVQKIMTDTYIEQDKFFSHNIKHQIICLNGILDLNTYELLPYDPEKIFFSKIPITYDPTQTCEQITQFFTEILKNPEDLPVMQEIMGSFLYKEYLIEKAAMLVGTGRNGKGKTLELMKRFLGPENVTSVPLQQMDSDMYSVSELHNKLANLAGDLDSRALKHTGRFKELTGRDTITVARKFKTRLSFVNHAKIVFAANELPKTYDLTPAFFMRWVILEFPYTFLKQEEYDELTDQKTLAFCKVRDPEKIDKITSPEQMSGMLNWAIEGLKHLRTNKDFSYNKSVDDVKDLWFRKSDSFTAFCLDHLEEKYGFSIEKSELRHRYHMYCKKHDLKTAGDKLIKEHLTRQLGVWDEYVLLDGNRIWRWGGVGFREKIDDNQQKFV